MTYLLRVNDKGEIVDATGKVVARVVPVTATKTMLDAGYFSEPSGNRAIWNQMLSAATLDIAALAVPNDVAAAVRRCAEIVDCACPCRIDVLSELSMTDRCKASYRCTSTSGECHALQAADIRAEFPEVWK